MLLCVVSYEENIWDLGLEEEKCEIEVSVVTGLGLIDQLT